MAEYGACVNRPRGAAVLLGGLFLAPGFGLLGVRNGRGIQHPPQHVIRLAFIGPPMDKDQSLALREWFEKFLWHWEDTEAAEAVVMVFESCLEGEAKDEGHPLPTPQAVLQALERREYQTQRP